MLQQPRQPWPIPRHQPQAALNQIAAVGADVRAAIVVEHGQADLLVRGEGRVAEDQVEEEDPEGPDGARLGHVAAGQDPLGWRVHTCAVSEVSVGLTRVDRVDATGGPEVDKPDAAAAPAGGGGIVGSSCVNNNVLQLEK